MKIVINKCYGGFSLSRAAVKRMAELQGRECYFFEHERANFDKYIPSPEPNPEPGHDMWWTAFDIPNPNEVFGTTPSHELPANERELRNALWEKHYLNSRPYDRTDATLVRVVEELGEKAASGGLAELRIVEIPSGVQWNLDEYDGIESVHEVHRTWG